VDRLKSRIITVTAAEIESEKRGKRRVRTEMWRVEIGGSWI
jgi:hypothetical protein